MAEGGSPGFGVRLDITQLLAEAQYRWLRAAEILEILQHYRTFKLTAEPPDKPPSGSVFLFDRKVLRYYRRDGHNWRKKKDGKTVREAHEKLKVGSVDVLHCYYAHGEENENFQRRSYWMLEQDQHIVFVHYLEAKGKKTNINYSGETESGGTHLLTNFQTGSPFSSTSSTNHNRDLSGNMDSPSPTSTLASSIYEDAESEYHKGSPSSSSVTTINYMSLSRGIGVGELGNATYIANSQKTLDLESWVDVYEKCTADFQTQTSQPSSSASEVFFDSDDALFDQLLYDKAAIKQESVSIQPSQGNWQIPFDVSLHSDAAYDLEARFFGQTTHDVNLQNSPASLSSYPDWEMGHPLESNRQVELSDEIFEYLDNNLIEGNSTYSSVAKNPLLDSVQAADGLSKVDSFSRWMAKELGEVDDLGTKSNSSTLWNAIENGNLGDSSSLLESQLDALLSPSLSQDQLFSITEFSPNWAYEYTESEVLITGRFLRSQQDVGKYKWSCMFGEIEVLAEVLSDRVIRCHAPPYRAGVVHFYVTCSDRLACSEVREFEYRVGPTQDLSATELHLHTRLERLLSLKSVEINCVCENFWDKQNIMSQLYSLMEEEKLDNMKEKVYTWLLHKVMEDGKGPSVLDEEGQGVLHLVAALGYSWAMKPIIVAGVNINFRDVNGWTALHWAAFCGRERTVAALVSLGAASGLVTDPTPEFPLGRTPADVASRKGHKGISGFLAETSLTNFLSSLTMNSPKEQSAFSLSGDKAFQTVSERTATPTNNGDVAETLSLKDSLTAVTNATQAAGRIHQVFRMQSFERKKPMKLQGYDEIGLLTGRALSLLGAKTSKQGQNDGYVHAAATNIQKNFRGWTKRKEFLITRQRIVKIQAHVRGHQVRKQYRAITWSVGILEKVILRWRRKKSGLRGYRPDTAVEASAIQGIPKAEEEDDDYDFLKQGRKQSEERLQKALVRVKSMVQYPEGRAQYRRLLKVVEGLRETKETSNWVRSNSEEIVDYDEDLIDVEALLDDDNFMAVTFD